MLVALRAVSDLVWYKRGQTRSHLRIHNKLLFVGGLRKTTTPMHLCRFFEQFGVVTAGMIISEKKGQSKVKGFITLINQLNK